ncbi:hypothetical protein [Kitasatospora sp. KL5]
MERFRAHEFGGPLFDGGEEVGGAAAGDLLLVREVLPAPGRPATAA